MLPKEVSYLPGGDRIAHIHCNNSSSGSLAPDYKILFVCPPLEHRTPTVLKWCEIFPPEPHSLFGAISLEF